MPKNSMPAAISCLCLILLLATACGPTVDRSTEGAPIRDEDGATLTRDELVERLSSGGWVAAPVHGEDGSVSEILVSRRPTGPMHGRPDFAPPPGAFMIDDSVPIRDESGRKLTFEEFMTTMDGGGWRPEPKLDDNGEVVEITLIRDDTATSPNAPMNGSILSPAALRDKWIGNPMPSLDLTTLDGRKIGAAELEGRVVVLNFWFRACKPCIMEIPELNELVEAFEGRDVVFVALTFDDEEQTREALGEHPFDYQIVSGAADIHSQFGIEGYPTHLVFDPDHRGVAVFSGYSPGIGRTLGKEIEAALEK